MAQGLFLSVACALGCGLLLTGAVGAPAVGGGALWRHRALELAARVGSSEPFDQLLGWESWASCGAWLRELLGRSGLVLGRYETSGLMVGVLGVAGLALSLLGGTPLLFPVTVAGGLIAVPLVASEREQRREDAVVEAMPDLLRSLASSLGAGMTLTQAIGYVGTHTRGDAGRAFRHASLEVACGASVAEALGGLERTLVAPGVGLLSCALVVSQRTGASLDGLLNRSADLVEEQAELVASLATKTAQARLSAKVVMVMPVLIVLLMSLVLPDYRDGLTSPVGVICLLVSGALDVTAMALMRHLMAKVQP